MASLLCSSLCSLAPSPKQGHQGNLSGNGGTHACQGPASNRQSPLLSQAFFSSLTPPPTQLCSLVLYFPIVKLKVQSEDQVAWVDGTEGPRLSQVDSTARGRGRKENAGGETEQYPVSRAQGSEVYPELPRPRVPGPENT